MPPNGLLLPRFTIHLIAFPAAHFLLSPLTYLTGKKKKKKREIVYDQNAD